MSINPVRPLALLILPLLPLVQLGAQSSPPPVEFPAASPASTLKQRVGLTDIEISYSRPGVKGRTIFGELVPYNQVWRTGANAATKIKFSTPVKLNGTDVAAGSYELFTIPNQEEWTIIIHKDSSEWGAYRYDPKNDVARFSAKPTRSAESAESFTIGIDNIRDETATLYLAWENSFVPVQLEVDVAGVLLPQLKAVMNSDAEKKPYFQAAMFYLDHDVDLTQASEWMDAAVKAQPDAFWVHHHRARLLAKLGQKEEAVAAAKRSIELAQKAGGAVQSEYIRLNEALLAKLK